MKHREAGLESLNFPLELPSQTTNFSSPGLKLPIREMDVVAAVITVDLRVKSCEVLDPITTPVRGCKILDIVNIN